jgi:3-hydroxyacyl-CoA dehydrogenase/enoyl-CoA hydratase/3-hydroxybutyryl-CoA epimerase
MNSEVPDLRLGVADGLATLTFDRPDSKVNLLTRRVMLRLEELLEAIEEGIAAGDIRALVVRSAKPDNFIAGADLDELAGFHAAAATAEIARRGQAIFWRLERLPIPTIAAINGTCVGGGTELALACDYRVASNSPRMRIGLPETRLGILPGLGGTVRLPRLVGIQPALDLILSGRLVGPSHALEIGLVDRVFSDPDFEQEVADIVDSLARGSRPLARRRRPALARLLMEAAPARWIIRRLTRKALLARTKGHYPALPLALDTIIYGFALDPQRAHELEAKAFGSLAVTQVCKNLIRVFELTENARKKGPAGVAGPVEGAAVVGAGVMGAGIAELFAYQGIPVQVVDVDDKRVAAGVARARTLLEKAAARADWSDADLKAKTDCLLGTTSYDRFDEVDLVIESVLERMEIKRQVIAEIERRGRPSAVIATNTSALSVSQLQQDMQRPERLCGLHFFNPPHRMPLVEVVRGTQTSDDTLATAFQAAARLGKTPIVVADFPGFVVNRILAAYLTEAGHLFSAGLTIQEIDRSMTRFGMPVGPLRLLDEIGLDVVAEVSETMMTNFGARFAPAAIMEAVLATGVTGRKGRLGFYRWRGSRPKEVNQNIARLQPATTAGRPPAIEEAEQRMVLVMVNEAARTLDDGVVDSIQALDVAMIMGTGFPPFHGGLLRYADSLGLANVVERLRWHAGRSGPRFEPAAGLLSRSAFYAT